MAAQTVTCPNPKCRAALKLSKPPAPGAKVRCPRCGTSFAAQAPEPETIGLAAEEVRPCPSCRAPLAPGAVLCVKCGFNLKTGEKLQAPKKARKKSAGRSGDGPLTEDDLPELLSEAEKLIGLAYKELGRMPYVLGTDASMDDLRRAGRTGRCANPNCKMGLGGSLVDTNRRSGTSTITITVQFETVTVELCEDCTQMLLEDLASRDGTARGYLAEARGDLERAARRFPDEPRIDELRADLRKVELLAGRKKSLLKPCFIATAAFGGPFAAEVETLRRFRDEVLARSALGRLLTRAYEAVSPPLAALLARSPRGRAAVRRLLRPVAALCRRRLGDPDG